MGLLFALAWVGGDLHDGGNENNQHKQWNDGDKRMWCVWFHKSVVFVYTYYIYGLQVAFTVAPPQWDGGQKPWGC